MSERGRPTAYRPEYAEQAAKLCALGATDYELADFFKVDTRTIYRWKNVHEDFCQALIAGKENADTRVERALYNRAVGYTFESEKVFQFQGQIVRADTTEHVPPDPSAAKLWLTNRKPEDWRDKQEHSHSGQVMLTPTINFNGKPE
ncbi:helix-turn-helix domain-containing protein [Aquamicrobium lusatiense]|uniref:helix-turn-helix domain-containing protein n=1 Tax=Aquamicrobium lusatiense TaxID=89772 RepID=UPI00245519C7|nr:helix-turn-helix domain-containing protein [Aquamicrobium lusatiense]MDH4993036.1 helix-turn-helix domain-containing protein [Aquamicrobium lusatiense]